jgi:hypothetical protein
MSFVVDRLDHVERFDAYREFFSDKVIPDKDRAANAALMVQLLADVRKDFPMHVDALAATTLKNGSKPGTPNERMAEGRYVTRAVVAELHDRLLDLVRLDPDGVVASGARPGPQDHSSEHGGL